MSSSHGSTPAAWTTVIVMLAGFVVAAIGVVLLDWWIIGIGFGVVVLGGVVGKVMQMMGMGRTASYTQPAAEELAEGRRTPASPRPSDPGA